MPLRAGSLRPGLGLQGTEVFISASIPDPTRWEGDYNPLEITDAVTAAARAVLTETGRIITAAHPTIAPLLLYVAAEFPPMERPSIIVYQSDLFEGLLPEATRRFEEHSTGLIRWTKAAPGDLPEPGKWERSLRIMREAMLRRSDPQAAIFIGGMGGLVEEHSLFREIYPKRPWYALSRPGGVARQLALEGGAHLSAGLQSMGVYPALFSQVVADIARARQDGRGPSGH